MSLELIVLGSGGPFANPKRASSGYLLLLDGDPRVLVGAGGGVFERLGRLGADPAAIDHVLLTHTHIDHSGGLAPIVFAAAMAGRTQSFELYGPAGRGEHPGAARFAELLFGEQGAWSYLHSFPGFGVEARELPSDPAVDGEPQRARGGDPEIRSVAVAHGMMPSVAYRIEHAGRSVVVSGDPERYEQGLAELARGCDVLVHDFALPEREVEHGELHAKPSEVGRLAADSGCGTLVLSHVMPELEDELDAAVAEVRRFYDGELVVASDLLRLPV